jgi:hypothetical protein
MASLIPEVFMFANPLGDFSFDGRREHRLSALAKHLGQYVLGGCGWKRNRRCANFLHGGVLLGNWVLDQPNSNPSTPPFSTPHPQLLVISPPRAKLNT